MTREIKFRIWDKKNKKWAENTASLNCFAGWRIDPFTGKISQLITAPNHRIIEFDDDSRYELSQFTGVRGADGVEIYEGDILEISSTVMTKIFGIPSYTEGEVKWLNDSWKVCQKVIGSTHLSDHVEYDPDDRKHIKVIGNRYEGS